MSDRYMKYNEVNGLGGNIRIDTNNKIYEKVLDDEYEYIKIDLIRNLTNDGKIKIYINEATDNEALEINPLLNSFELQEIGIRKIRIALEDNSTTGFVDLNILLMR